MTAEIPGLVRTTRPLTTETVATEIDLDVAVKAIATGIVLGPLCRHPTRRPER